METINLETIEVEKQLSNAGYRRNGPGGRRDVWGKDFWNKYEKWLIRIPQTELEKPFMDVKAIFYIYTDTEEADRARIADSCMQLTVVRDFVKSQFCPEEMETFFADMRIQFERIYGEKHCPEKERNNEEK